jgi:hypothetical protein
MMDFPERDQADIHNALLILLDGENKLNAKDREIVADLCHKRYKYGYWSPKQTQYADALFKRGMGQQPDDRPKVAVGSFAGVYKLLEGASAHLKYPKIQLAINNRPVVLYRSGPKSKYEGTINVTDGGDFGNNKWYGRVDKEGNWTHGRTYPELNEVEGLLKKLGESPQAVAKEYGRLTGRCCFCGHKLEDEKSTAAGFGPVCAKHYGLENEWKNAVAVLDQKEAA